MTSVFVECATLRAYQGMLGANRMKLARALRRGAIISLIVGSSVSLGHALLPNAWWWPVAHAALPASVFSLSAWMSGQRKVTAPLLFRGLATVLVVALSFTLANDVLGLSRSLAVVANYLVPLCVSLAGSVSGARTPARPQAGPRSAS